jgi:hypothetical protein
VTLPGRIGHGHFAARANHHETEPPTRTGNGASHSQKPEENHRQRGGDHQESEEAPEQSGSAQSSVGKSIQDSEEPEGNYQESEEDSRGSRQNAHTVVVALPPSMTSSIALV